jgi:hypothetical protein
MRSWRRFAKSAEQHGTIIRPGNEGRGMITDDEGTRAEGRPSDCVARCSAADCRDYFEMQLESDFETESWDRRQQASREPRNGTQPPDGGTTLG